MTKKIPPKDGQSQRKPLWQAFNAVQEYVGYQFKNPDLLNLALTHSSWANENGHEGEHNERLEFLGDAVLELCVSQELFKRYPQMREGMLTDIRGELVSEPFLANLARQTGISDALRLGRGEERQEGRKRDSLLADALEAVLAAIFLDGGFEAAERSIWKIYEDKWVNAQREPKAKDAKTQLQEECQKRFKNPPHYALLHSSGPDHAKIFVIQLTLPDGQKFLATASAQKKAEHAAAAQALASLQ